jgi:hypothetical protein
MSSPPIRPSNRRKTLAGMMTARAPGLGFTLQKTSERIKAQRKAKPVAAAAETLVCRGLGIIQDGEVITELALQEFARRFDGQISDEVFEALRALFKVASPDEEEIDDALINLGGATGLELEVRNDDVNV